MVKIKEGKLKWALKQKDIKNKELASRCKISIRRFQQLKAIYKKTKEIPKLIKTRRPKTMLKEEDKVLINKALEESKLEGAVTIRLYITKYYDKNLPYGKIHQYLLEKGISQKDEKKQKQRKYKRYERKHSFSLVHLDWHESKAIKGKQVCVVEDDATRLIISGNEFNNSFEENNIKLMENAIKLASERYNSLIKEVNTDKGSQFYANKNTNNGDKAKSKFEIFLDSNGIKHIPSRRNHPQTNGKNERWFKTYEENRSKFTSFEEFMKWYNNRIHLGLSRTEGITPNEIVFHKLRPECLIGLFFRRL